MKKLALLLLVATIAGMMVSCATFATNKDLPQKTIPILGFVSGSLVPQGEEIASYTKFIGICFGYDDFVQQVQGKDYDVVEKWLFIFNKVYAIAK